MNIHPSTLILNPAEGANKTNYVLNAAINGILLQIRVSLSPLQLRLIANIHLCPIYYSIPMMDSDSILSRRPEVIFRQLVART